MSVPTIAMEDDLGIVYVVENAQQFWSELEDVLHFSKDAVPTLSQLDLALKRSLALCAAYHEQYLQTPMQIEHACDLILESELFAFHSERMCEILMGDIQSTTDPHMQLIFYHLLLHYGRRTRHATGTRAEFFRNQKKWQPVLPLLMDHIEVDIDEDAFDIDEDFDYYDQSAASGSSGDGAVAVPVPIEAKLRSLSVKLLYEVCRVQRFNIADLRVFPSQFIDFLFDLVEQTRDMRNDAFNYSVIKLIVALNEQFMVASLQASHTPSPSGSPAPDQEHHRRSSSVKLSIEPEGKNQNRVLSVLMRRLGTSKTFGENVIFMLNRSKRTPEDLTTQLLLLKILYLLFTTKGTEDFFYTNDLFVLVDVFLRELGDLMDVDETDAAHGNVLESLRHTYLRVLHPLLTKTELREVPYKRAQVAYLLESIVSSDGRGGTKEVGPTTRRLAERCLGGDWAHGLRSQRKMKAASDIAAHIPHTSGGAAHMSSSAVHMHAASSSGARPTPHRLTSKSVENLSSTMAGVNIAPPPPLPTTSTFLTSVGGSGLKKSGGLTKSVLVQGARADRAHAHRYQQAAPHDPIAIPVADGMADRESFSPMSISSASSVAESDASVSTVERPYLSAGERPHRRAAPAPPKKRRKPPAIPVSAGLERTSSGAFVQPVKPALRSAH
ncbi:hypothetical protein BD626DRAFT_566020 [Schizophyllum amplum]|uniref:SPIN90/Ldb17 leucine-rich domain-containing protein n=1 Tax=Schizophyllum amplum TaxID=97359 RepID=A0A550CQB8_9AGAR|nr:hypothetical protein BD626DRAFT_566020 [Auriculariopsis ampla]